MLDTDTKRRIDTARDILVGKVPDPKSQVEQITIALIYKFMDDMDAEAKELGGERSFFTGEFEKYGWSNLMAPGMGGHDVLNLYSEGITRMNENAGIPLLFREIFKNAYLPYRDPETLKSFLKIIDDFEYDHSERLGDAFEYLLSVLGSQGDAGQFRTPRHIIDFMVEVMDPKKDETILDPACGTAGFLISAYKHILKSNAKDGKPGAGLTPDERAQLAENIKGYDISPDMVRLSLVNLYLHGFTDPHIYEYDTLTSEDRWNEYANVTLANPPFMSPKGGIKPHKRFSVQSKRSEVLFVDYMAEHLTPNGRAAIIVPEGIIFQSGSAYKQLRKMLVEEYLFAVVSLPSGVFQPYSGVKTSILLIDKTLAKKSDSILFVKIENDGFDLGAQRRQNGKSDLPEAVCSIKNHVSGIVNSDTFDTENITNVLVVAKEKIGENGDWNLSGERYRENDKFQISNYEFVELGKIIDLNFGTRITKKNDEGKKYPVYGGGGESFRTDQFNRESELIISRFAMSAKCVRYVDNKFFMLDSGFTYFIKNDCENKIDKRYVDSILLNIQDKIYACSRGHAQKNLDVKQFKQINFPFPPLEIQKEIVAEIEGYQKIIDGARAVVENYKPQIQIDPEWEMMELKNVCKKITDGTHKTPKYITEGVPFYRVTDITKSNSGKKFISEEEHLELIKRCKPEKSDILYSKNGTIGIAKMVDWDFEFSIFVSLALLKPDTEKLIPKYFETFLNTENALTQAKAHSKSGTVTNLHLIEIKQMKIPLPSLEIQNHIVARIEKEQALVDANKELITIFEQKIKDKIASVWGE